jgi:hypothetical protein
MSATFSQASPDLELISLSERKILILRFLRRRPEREKERQVWEKVIIDLM